MRHVAVLLVVGFLFGACESERSNEQNNSGIGVDTAVNTDGNGVPGFGNDDTTSSEGSDDVTASGDAGGTDMDDNTDSTANFDTSDPSNDTTEGPNDDTAVCVPNCVGKECGDDGCGDVCGTCDGNTECQPNGTCAIVTSESCKDLASCIGPCGGNAACAQGCVANSSPAVQEQVQDINDCVSQNCQSCGQTDAVCIQKCTFENCSEQYFGCFSGGSTCMGLLQCMQTCAGNQGCAAACVAEGTKDAQLAYYEIVYCVFDECGPNPSAQCQQTATGAGGPCQSLVNGCASN